MISDTKIGKNDIDEFEIPGFEHLPKEWRPRSLRIFTKKPGRRSISTQELVDKFLLSKHKKIKPVTRGTYVSILNKFARKNPDLPETPEPVEAHLADIKATSTYNQNLSVIKLLYDFGELRLGVRNVMRMIKRIKDDDEEADCFTMEQVRAILDAIEIDRERALVYLYLGCGLRCSEAVGLDVGDIRQDRIFVYGKKRKEWYPLLLEVWEALLKLINGRGADEPLFLSNQKRRLCSDMARENIVALVRRAGIDGMKMTPHTLRHTFATLAYGAGCRKDLVSLLLRHRNKNVTDDYIHLSSQQRAEKIRPLLEKYSPLRLVNDSYKVPLYTLNTR